MESKTLKSIGGVASVIGAAITWFGYSKYDGARSMAKALNAGDHLFGGNSSDSIDLWSGRADNYKLVLIIGAVILVVGIILLISGFVSGNKGQEIKETVRIPDDSDKSDLADRLKKLDELKNSNLISQEEYEEKRKQLISSL